jgi:hypothetical protein
MGPTSRILPRKERWCAPIPPAAARGAAARRGGGRARPGGGVRGGLGDSAPQQQQLEPPQGAQRHARALAPIASYIQPRPRWCFLRSSPLLPPT